MNKSWLGLPGKLLKGGGFSYHGPSCHFILYIQPEIKTHGLEHQYPYEFEFEWLWFWMTIPEGLVKQKSRKSHFCWYNGGAIPDFPLVGNKSLNINLRCVIVCFCNSVLTAESNASPSFVSSSCGFLKLCQLSFGFTYCLIISFPSLLGLILIKQNWFWLILSELLRLISQPVFPPLVDAKPLT